MIHTDKHITILGIETSCDETACAVYQTDKGMLSNELFSQVDLHKQYGGVVPEVASRSHLEKIPLITQQALDKAHITLQDVDAIAVTYKPGLPGSLLVGLCFAKSLAYASSKRLIGVNHLQGHIYSACIEHDIPFPFLCITASGGHTALYIVHSFEKYELIGQTLDDAAGEAFDKVSKMLNLGYPGGPIIEKYARKAGFQDYFSYPRSMAHSLDFSFSGLKTAVLYDLVKQDAYDLSTKTFLKSDDTEFIERVASSFLVCVADIFIQKIARALKQYPHIKAVSFVGGVACNAYIKQRLSSFCASQSSAFFTPSPQYCTDNGAMIAYVGAHKALRNEYADFTLDIF
jgi:N6-L-threonylcarbamoyladenine synthase